MFVDVKLRGGEGDRIGRLTQGTAAVVKYPLLDSKTRLCLKLRCVSKNPNKQTSK